MVDCNPFYILQLIINETKKYKELISSLVDSLNKVHEISKDLLILKLIKTMSSEKFRLKSFHSVNQEFINLSELTAIFLKKN